MDKAKYHDEIRSEKHSITKGIAVRTDNEVQELNLSYLLLIQKLARDDMERAIELSSLSPEQIDMISHLTVTEIARISRCGVLLMRFNGDVEMFRKAMSNTRVESSVQDLHLAMIQLSRSEAT